MDGMSREGRLTGRTALVTGGSRGIGAAIAEAYAREGATVAIVHDDPVAIVDHTLEALRRSRRDCVAERCDIRDPTVLAKTLDRLTERTGSFDILVNCAGIGGIMNLDQMAVEWWSNVIDVNLTGTFLTTRYCYPSMKNKGWGRIINVASQMAFSGGVGVSAYCASKAGVLGFTRALAVEAAPFGVLVNCIAPGATQTDMLESCGEDLKGEILRKIPLGRFARPEEIAPTAVMLASEEGSFYVGQTLSPNGGDVFH